MKKTNYLNLLLSFLAAISLAGCATVGDVDTKSEAVLRKMSDKLTSAKQIKITATRKLDKRLLDNENMIGNAEIEAYVARPDRLKIKLRGGGNERHFYMAKSGATIYSTNSKFYANFPGQPTLDKSFDAAASKLGMNIPAQDFLSSNPYRDFTRGTSEITYVGSATVRGQTCDHIKGKSEKLEWNLWVSKSSHLPRRYTITVNGVEGENHLQVDFKKWDLSPSISKNTFTFSAPKDAQEIEFSR